MPYADFNALKLPDGDSDENDFALLTDRYQQDGMVLHAQGSSQVRL